MQTINLNLTPGGVMPVVNVSQYDEGRQFALVIYDGVASYDLTGKSLTIQGTKQDKKGFSYEETDTVHGARVITKSGNTVTVTAPLQMTAAAGRAVVELKIQDSSENVVHTLNFVLDVEKAALGEDTDISATELPGIIDAAASNAEAAAQSAADAERSATAAENSASNAADSASAAADSAVNAASSENAAAASANDASDAADRAETASLHPPYIGGNGNWWVFNTTDSEYVDSGIDASITLQISDITMLDPDAAPYVTNSGTDTDAEFHLFIPRGAKGDDGVGIRSIEKTGSTVTDGRTIDTYTLTYTNGKTFSYSIINGKDGDSASVSFDDYPKSGSTNAVRSNGVFASETGIVRGAENYNILLGTSQSKTTSDLIMGSENFTTWDPYTMQSTYADMKLSTDNYLTVSFDWEATNAPSGATAKVGTGAAPWEYFGVVINFDAGSSSGHVEARYKVQSSLISCASNLFRFRFDAAGGMKFTIKNAKLEISYWASPWSLNPSEVASGLSGKQDKLTFDTTPTSGSTNPVTSGGIKTYAPFKFGVDASGNYGYIKAGADTVTPFKNPTGTKEDTYTANGVYTPDVTDYASHKVTVNVPSTTPTLTSLDARGVRVIFEPYSRSEGISYDYVDVIGHNGSSYVYARTGGTATWVDAVVPTSGQSYIYIYWKSDGSNVDFGFKIAAIVPAYCTAAQGQATGTYSSLPRSYDATVTLANARTIQSAHQYGNSTTYCWRIDISSLKTSTTASGDGYAKTIYIPTQGTTSRTQETAIVPTSETISAAKTYSAGYYANAWTVTPQGSSPSLGAVTLSARQVDWTAYPVSYGYDGFSSVTVEAAPVRIRYINESFTLTSATTHSITATLDRSNTTYVGFCITYYENDMVSGACMAYLYSSEIGTENSASFTRGTSDTNSYTIWNFLRTQQTATNRFYATNISYTTTSVTITFMCPMVRGSSYTSKQITGVVFVH